MDKANIENVLVYNDKFSRVGDVVSIKGEEYNRVLTGKIVRFIDGLVVVLSILKGEVLDRRDVFIPDIEMVNDEVLIEKGEVLKSKCDAKQVLTIGNEFFKIGSKVTITYKKWFFKKVTVTGKIYGLYDKIYKVRLSNIVNYETEYTDINTYAIISCVKEGK